MIGTSQREDNGDVPWVWSFTRHVASLPMKRSVQSRGPDVDRRTYVTHGSKNVVGKSFIQPVVGRCGYVRKGKLATFLGGQAGKCSIVHSVRP